MNRREWALVLVLTGITIAALLSISPATVRQNVQAAAQAATMTYEAAHVAPATPTAPEIALAAPLPTRIAPMATPAPSPTPAPTWTPLMAPTPYPFDVRADLPRYIYVDQATQRMLIFEHGRLRRNIACSTGLPDDDTYTVAWEGRVGYYAGTFRSFGVYADDAWYLFQCQGAILVHSLPYTLEGDVKVYQDRELLGVRPSSHGCVRISPEDARWLTEWNPEGVLMTITDPYRDKWR
jgi:hypothetical protein